MPESVNPETLRTLEEISQACQTCPVFYSEPRRFLVAFPDPEVAFNEELALDLMWLNRRAVLHVAYTQTHLSNAVFLHGQSVEDVWRTFFNFWA